MLKQEKIDPLWKLMQPEFRPYFLDLVKNKAMKYPLVVDFDPTSSCNSACRFCIDASNLTGAYFPKQRMIKLLTELASMGTKAVVVVGGGEPLVYPYFEELLVLAKELGLQVGLVTNGLKLEDYLDLVASTCTWIRVSVDAAKESTYKFLHHPGEGDFAGLIKNMRTLAKIKHGSLGYSFILTKKNIGEIAAAADLAGQIGCDFFELKSLINPLNKSINKLSPPFQEELFRQLKELKTVRPKINIVLASSIISLLKKEGKQINARKCYAKRLRAVITPGGVYPCANLRGNPNWRLGDPLTEDFAFIWRRSNMMDIDPLTTCSGYCARREFNVALECLSLAEQKGASLINYLTDNTARIKAGDKYFI